jgi:hypothetical protein
MPDGARLPAQDRLTSEAMGMHDRGRPPSPSSIIWLPTRIFTQSCLAVSSAAPRPGVHGSPRTEKLLSSFAFGGRAYAELQERPA